MDLLDNYCLTAIFTYLDLSSRLRASKTCKLWRALLQNTGVLMDNISEVVLEKSRYEYGTETEMETMAAIFTHIGQCDHLNLSGPVSFVLLEPSIEAHLSRFGNVRLFRHDLSGPDRYATECLSMLHDISSIKSLSVHLRLADLSPVDLSAFNHLECLEFDVVSRRVGVQPRILLSPSLRQFTSSFISLRSRYSSEINQVSDGGCLDAIEACPLLEDLSIGGWRVDLPLFLRLFDPLRNRLSNLRRLRFRDTAFELANLNHDGQQNRNQPRVPCRRVQLNISPLQLNWISFERCTNDWFKMAHVLIKASAVRTVSISLKDQSDIHELLKVYRLTPLIEAKKATLELTINSISELNGIDFATPFEFSRVLAKLDLISASQVGRHLFKSIFDGVRFEKLIKINLRNCTGLGDAELATIAELCPMLKKITFKPHHWIDLHSITGQCLRPFFHFWDDRKSKELSIQCLGTDLAFGWFRGPPDQGRGTFDDGKRWVRFRNAAAGWKNRDGSVHFGTRMVTWSDDGKAMVIRDYEKDFRKKLRICMAGWACRVKVMKYEMNS